MRDFFENPRNCRQCIVIVLAQQKGDSPSGGCLPKTCPEMCLVLYTS